MTDLTMALEPFRFCGGQATRILVGPHVDGTWGASPLGTDSEPTLGQRWNPFGPFSREFDSFADGLAWLVAGMPASGGRDV